MIAIVTGAGTGIGRAIVQAMVAQGHHVALVGRTLATLEESAALARGGPGEEKGRGGIPLTQDDSAGMGGTDRPTVNQLLGKLADKALLEVARGRVIITDLAGLARKAR